LPPGRHIRHQVSTAHFTSFVGPVFLGERLLVSVPYSECAWGGFPISWGRKYNERFERSPSRSPDWREEVQRGRNPTRNTGRPRHSTVGRASSPSYHASGFGVVIRFAPITLLSPPLPSTRIDFPPSLRFFAFSLVFRPLLKTPRHCGPPGEGAWSSTAKCRRRVFDSSAQQHGCLRIIHTPTRHHPGPHTEEYPPRHRQQTPLPPPSTTFSRRPRRFSHSLLTYLVCYELLIAPATLPHQVIMIAMEMGSTEPISTEWIFWSGVWFKATNVGSPSLCAIPARRQAVGAV